MWTCPKCGREFKKINQGHYCGKAAESIDEYIEMQIPKARKYLAELRNIIQKCIPEVREKIAWSMPFFENDKCSISMSACKNHISLYVDKEMIDLFMQESKEFTTKKNAIYFPYDKELPIKFIENMMKHYF